MPMCGVSLMAVRCVNSTGRIPGRHATGVDLAGEPVFTLQIFSLYW